MEAFAVILTFAASAFIAAIVLAMVAYDDLRDEARHRAAWIATRNAINDAYKRLMDSRRTCKRANFTMRLLGWRNPKYPPAKRTLPIWYT